MKHKTDEPAYQITLDDEPGDWPECQNCGHQYAPMKPVKGSRGRMLIPRLYCRRCKARIQPLKLVHIAMAEANWRLIRRALSLHRKDLYSKWCECESFRKEMREWCILPLAFMARRHKPELTEFSTYAIAGLRNWLYRDYPPYQPMNGATDDEGRDIMATFDAERKRPILDDGDLMDNLSNSCQEIAEGFANKAADRMVFSSLYSLVEPSTNAASFGNTGHLNDQAELQLQRGRLSGDAYRRRI